MRRRREAVAVTPAPSPGLGLPLAGDPLPDVSDYYRFVLSRPELDGLLASPSTPEEV
jgi:hypothetical protein